MAPSWVAGITRVTGDVVSAADWNQYLGVDGSLDYLGSVHAHEAGAGEGSTLALKAVLGVGIHALGCMQGVGVNVLRIEYVQTGWTSMADGGTHTYASGAWANAFGTLLAVLTTVEKAADTGTNVSSHLISTHVTNGASCKVDRAGIGGNDVNTRVHFLALGY